MNNITLIAPWIRRFLLEHLVRERNLALNTQASYRDTLTLLLPFASRKIKKKTFEGPTPSIKITGKARKVRHCPLWSLTCSVLKPLVYGRDPDNRVFLNRRAQPITRFGIHGLVKRYAAKASEQEHSLRKKEVSPHTIRHTTAVFLLRAGVDINTIRAWLGHLSLDTTHIYAEVDLEMKTKALAHCEILTTGPVNKQWHKRGIMDFLKAL